MTFTNPRALYILVLAVLCSLLLTRIPPVNSLSLPDTVAPRQFRDDGPVFPDDPPSCPICERDYGSINSCAEACPIFANFSMILFNPGAFISVIECACTDTFQSAYPQCVDCFQKTDQTAFLNITSDDVPDILTGMRNICGISSTILGNVSNTNGETTPDVGPSPTPSPNSALDPYYILTDFGGQRGVFGLLLGVILISSHVGSLFI